MVVPKISGDSIPTEIFCDYVFSKHINFVVTKVLVMEDNGKYFTYKCEIFYREDFCTFLLFSSTHRQLNNQLVFPFWSDSIFCNL
jgi:hypothetical protein